MKKNMYKSIILVLLLFNVLYSTEINNDNNEITKIYISNDRGIDNDNCGTTIDDQCKTIQYAINIFKNTHTLKKYMKNDGDQHALYSYPPLEISMDQGVYDSDGNSDINLYELIITFSAQQQEREEGEQQHVVINNFNSNKTIFTVIKDPSHSQRDSVSRFSNDNDNDHISQTQITFRNIKSTYTRSNNHFGSFLYANTHHTELIINVDIYHCEFNSSVPSHTKSQTESSLFAITGHYDAESKEPRTFIRIRDSKFNNHKGSNYNQLKSSGVLAIRSKSNDVVLDIDSSVFTDNTGGVISMSSCSSFTLTNSVFTKNLQDNSAIHLSNCKVFKLTNTSFQSNSANSQGGALSITRSSGIIDTCQFNENTAAQGGAIHVSGQSKVTIINTTLNANLASQLGGAIMSDWSSIEIIKTNFTNNRAMLFGPAFYCAYSSVNIQGHECNFEDNYLLNKFPKQMYQGFDCVNVLYEEPTCTFKATNQTTLDTIVSNGNCSRGWTNFFFENFMTIIYTSMILFFFLAFYILSSMSKKNIESMKLNNNNNNNNSNNNDDTNTINNIVDKKKKNKRD